MMQQRPVIAILTANVLVGVGLRSILEKAAPAADVELFGNFQEFAEADPERFIHYFVTAQLFAAHNAFFRARRNTLCPSSRRLRSRSRSARPKC